MSTSVLSYDGWELGHISGYTEEDLFWGFLRDLCLDYQEIRVLVKSSLSRKYILKRWCNVKKSNFHYNFSYWTSWN